MSIIVHNGPIVEVPVLDRGSLGSPTIQVPTLNQQFLEECSLDPKP